MYIRSDDAGNRRISRCTPVPGLRTRDEGAYGTFVTANEHMPSLVERGVGAIAAVGLILTCLLILSPFISATLWAAILCFATWPLFARLTALLGGRRTLAAALATLILSAVVITPVAILVAQISGNIDDIIAATRKLVEEGPPKPPHWVASIPILGPQFAARWSILSESSAERLAAISKWLPTIKDALLGSGRALAKGFSQVVLSLLMTFLLYRDGEAVAARLATSVYRIAGERGKRLLEVAGTTVTAVVYGVLGTAMLQGVLGAVGFMLAGVPGAALFGFLIFVVGVIPGGPLLVGLGPILWLYRQGSIEWAIFLAVWVAFVGNLDSILRPILIARGHSNLPLILVIFGVLGGAMAFGLIGLFLGPTLVAVGVTLFEQWYSRDDVSPGMEDERGVP